VASSLLLDRREASASASRSPDHPGMPAKARIPQAWPAPAEAPRGLHCSHEGVGAPAGHDWLGTASLLEACDPPRTRVGRRPGPGAIGGTLTSTGSEVRVAGATTVSGCAERPVRWREAASWARGTARPRQVTSAAAAFRRGDLVATLAGHSRVSALHRAHGHRYRAVGRRGLADRRPRVRPGLVAQRVSLVLVHAGRARGRAGEHHYDQRVHGFLPGVAHPGLHGHHRAGLHVDGDLVQREHLFGGRPRSTSPVNH
jgi:hypothetical protein